MDKHLGSFKERKKRFLKNDGKPKTSFLKRLNEIKKNLLND